MGVERLPVGPIGVVSQSGALMATMFSRGYDVGVGFSILVSVGNQADVTENEVFAHLICDEATRAIVLYLEGISDSARLLALADQARAAGKPVIAVKAGRSEAGRRATFSHTASLAGQFKLFASAARSRGIVLTEEPEASAWLRRNVRQPCDERWQYPLRHISCMDRPCGASWMWRSGDNWSRASVFGLLKGVFCSLAIMDIRAHPRCRPGGGGN